jgi:hypothetical protein
VGNYDGSTQKFGTSLTNAHIPLKSLTRKAALIATHYADQMSAAERSMKNNITELGIYEQ